MVERTKTGIEGLDKALNGGFPKGNVVLVSGGAGTGKSTLCLQYLINGATMFGEKGLYISTEQTKKEIYKTAEGFGWNLESLEMSNKLKIVYFDVVETDGFIEKMYELYTTFMPKRVIIDSLTTLADSLMVSNASSKEAFSLVKISDSVSPIPQSERIIQKSLLYHLMKKLRLFDSTILLTSELIDGEKGLSADQISEFICDGVMTIELISGFGKGSFRNIRIRKMRYTVHATESLSFDILKEGISISQNGELQEGRGASEFKF